MQYAVGFGEFRGIIDHRPGLSEQTNASHTRLFVKIVFPDKNKKCLSGTKKNRLKQCECLSRKKKFPAPEDGADKIMTQDWRWIAKKTELEKLKVLPLRQHLKVYRLWTFARRVKTSLDFWLYRS